MLRLATALLPVLLGTAAVVGAPHAADDPLTRHRWRSRVLVVAAPDRTDPRFLEQERLYRQARDGMRERDLVLLPAVGQGAEAAALRRRYDVQDGAFAVVLVGKDGGEKLRAASPIPASQLFETVDEMPMRQDEMRRAR